MINIKQALAWVVMVLFFTAVILCIVALLDSFSIPIVLLAIAGGFCVTWAVKNI